MPRQVLDLPQNVTVIGRQELDERMVRDVQDLVRYEPGISVAKTTSGTDPFGNLAGFTIRGVSNNRVQMLVDGTRVIESIVDGNRDFVNMSNLKAVEIIRGPAGVMWGADALGGVVAFVTKDPEDYLKGRKFGGQLDTGFDSYDKSFFKTGTSAFRFGDFSAMISASQRSYNEGTLSKARADGGIYGCPRNPEAIRCNQLNPLDGNDYDLLGKLVWNPDKENEVKLTGEFLKKDATVDQRFDLGLQTSGIRNLSYIRNQIQTRERSRWRIATRPNLGWLDQVKWQVSHSPQERDFTGVQKSPSRQQPERPARLSAELQGEVHRRRHSAQFVVQDLPRHAQADLRRLRQRRGDRLRAPRHHDQSDHRSCHGRQCRRIQFRQRHDQRVDGFLQDEILLLNDKLDSDAGRSLRDLRTRSAAESVLCAPSRATSRSDIQSEKLVKQFGAVFKATDEHFAGRPLCGRLQDADRAAALSRRCRMAAASISDLIPNPNLRPEQVKSYEIGMRGQFSKGLLLGDRIQGRLHRLHPELRAKCRASTFRAFTICTYQNLSSVKLWGVEFAGEFRFHEILEREPVAWPIPRASRRPTATSPVDAVRRHDAVLGRVRAALQRSSERFRCAADLDLVRRRAGAQLAALYRPDGYVVFDAIVGWSPQCGAGADVARLRC